MKTYEQFRTEILKSEAFQKMTIQELETTAAKEYAKMWLDRFVEKIEWIDENIGGDILDIKNEIDEQ